MDTGAASYQKNSVLSMGKPSKAGFSAFLYEMRLWPPLRLRRQL
jgi:hypothetical protein